MVFKHSEHELFFSWEGKLLIFRMTFNIKKAEFLEIKKLGGGTIK